MLVVDDEPDARDLIAAVLIGRGAEVVSVESGGEALVEMERQRFDVLVSDIGMPLMDGYALIERVRQLPVERGGRIPAAALTAYAGSRRPDARTVSGIPDAHSKAGRARQADNRSGQSCREILRAFDYQLSEHIEAASFSIAATEFAPIDSSQLRVFWFPQLRLAPSLKNPGRFSFTTKTRLLLSACLLPALAFIFPNLMEPWSGSLVDYAGG